MSRSTPAATRSSRNGCWTSRRRRRCATRPRWRTGWSRRASRTWRSTSRATCSDRAAPAAKIGGVDASIEISTERDRIDRGLVHAFLRDHSYWASTRTREENDRVIDACLTFGAYENGRQLGYARVLTDTVAFAYVGDVFVLPAARGRGIGKA